MLSQGARINTSEKRYELALRSLGCAVCLQEKLIDPFSVPENYTSIHHIIGFGACYPKFGPLAILALCDSHHNAGLCDEKAISLHENKLAFYARYGDEIDLAEWIYHDYLDAPQINGELIDFEEMKWIRDAKITAKQYQNHLESFVE